MKKLVISLLAAAVVAGVFFSVKAYAYHSYEKSSILIDDNSPYEVDTICPGSGERCCYTYTDEGGKKSHVGVPGRSKTE